MPLLVKNESTILFLHIPKCGGSSIVELFKNNGYSIQLEIRGLPPQSCLRASPQHLTYDELKSIVRPEFLTDIFILTRNPYARILSEYNWAFRDTNQNSRPDVNEWIINSIKETAKNPNYADNHFRPMVDFIEPNVPCKIFKLEGGLEIIAEYFLRQDCGLTPIKMPRQKDATKFAGSIKEFNFNHQALAFINSFYRHDFTAFDYEMKYTSNSVNPASASINNETSKTKARVDTSIRLSKHTLKVVKSKIDMELEVLADLMKRRINLTDSYLEEKNLEPLKGCRISTSIYDDLLLSLNHAMQNVKNLTRLQENNGNLRILLKQSLRLMDQYRSRLSLNNQK